MRFGNDMITFEEAVATCVKYAEPGDARFTVKKNPADSRDLKWFLKKIGNPEKDLRIIHVAGTNGKGSVCAYMSSILQEAGYRTAVFTSPHLVDMGAVYCQWENDIRRSFFAGLPRSRGCAAGGKFR